MWGGNESGVSFDVVTPPIVWKTVLSLTGKIKSALIHSFYKHITCFTSSRVSHICRHFFRLHPLPVCRQLGCDKHLDGFWWSSCPMCALSKDRFHFYLWKLEIGVTGLLAHIRQIKSVVLFRTALKQFLSLWIVLVKILKVELIILLIFIYIS